MRERRSLKFFLMKRVLIIVAAVFVFFAACKDADKKSDNKLPAQAMKEKADSLYTSVIDEHDAGMAGWMRIKGRQKQINGLLDSIAKLPARAQASLADLKVKLNEAN